MPWQADTLGDDLVSGAPRKTGVDRVTDKDWQRELGLTHRQCDRDGVTHEPSSNFCKTRTDDNTNQKGMRNLSAGIVTNRDLGRQETTIIRELSYARLTIEYAIKEAAI
jgi:hypothetical protein